MFGRKKEEKQESDLLDRVISLEKRMKAAENDILGLATENQVIRNKVLRKIQFKREEAQEDNSPKVLNSPFGPSL